MARWTMGGTYVFMERGMVCHSTHVYRGKVLAGVVKSYGDVTPCEVVALDGTFLGVVDTPGGARELLDGHDGSK